jgi:tRNA threonylcarbamoyladenosine modification (KEOPS) complex  Pcc1 subunit
MNMQWPYTKRPDGKIAVTLDNNVWDFLFQKRIKLALELPSEEFAIFITREVEIETSAIPTKDSKTALKDYIARTIVTCNIKTTSVFGFARESPGPERLGGFGQGTWQSRTESEFYAAIRERYLCNKREKKSQLTGNEGDAAVAAQSFFSIALTCELPQKVGPLRFAAEHGGKILYLEGFDGSGLTLNAYIESFYQQI